jgi:hypothetical protein
MLGIAVLMAYDESPYAGSGGLVNDGVQRGGSRAGEMLRVDFPLGFPAPAIEQEHEPFCRIRRGTTHEPDRLHFFGIGCKPAFCRYDLPRGSGTIIEVSRR